MLHGYLIVGDIPDLSQFSFLRVLLPRRERPPELALRLFSLFSYVDGRDLSHCFMTDATTLHFTALRNRSSVDSAFRSAADGAAAAMTDKSWTLSMEEVDISMSTAIQSGSFVVVEEALNLATCKLKRDSKFFMFSDAPRRVFQRWMNAF